MESRKAVSEIYELFGAFYLEGIEIVNKCPIIARLSVIKRH
jgi:hypothetical protein